MKVNKLKFAKNLNVTNIALELFPGQINDRSQWEIVKAKPKSDELMGSLKPIQARFACCNSI